MQLNDLLTDIPGVLSADVQLVDGEVRSVRVELEPEADEQAVGGAIREVLAAYGYRSRVAPPRGKVEPEEPPPPPSPDQSLSEQSAGRPSPEEAAPRGVDAISSEEPAWADTGAARPGEQSVTSVTVTETPTGTRVAVEGVDGAVVTRHASRDRISEAIVEAVADLVGCQTAVQVVDLDRRDDGAVLVVVEFGDGRRAAGAALRRSGWQYAVAEAAWQALTRS